MAHTEDTLSGNRKKIGAASVGQFGEIFDFAVFGFSVPILATHFFHSSSPQAAILSTFTVYAVAFFARPLGGLFFGYLADRIGRVRILSITIWLMAGATAAIGFLPTYATIGIAAPILLAFCRLLQGFAMGGETSGATSYILESAPDDKRGFWVGVVWFFGHLPNAFVAIMLAVLQFAAGPEIYSDWVWRLPFILGGLIGIVGFWMRRNLEEPKEYVEAKRTSDAHQLREDRRASLRSMLYLLLIQPVQTVGSYLLLGFMYTFLVRQAGLDANAALASNAIAVFVLSMFLVVGGFMADRIGRKPVLTAGALWIACAAYPALQFASAGTFTGALVGQMLIGIGIGLYGGASFAAAVEFFPTSFRATGHAVSYQLTVAIFGGTTPLIAAWLVGYFGTPIAPGFYVIAVAIMGVVAVQFVPETRNARLRQAAGEGQATGPLKSSIATLEV
ncbi:MFS transporter [Aureimonas sp. Leaf324]|uniref:MFS transporter n=1 Tax=Aureimonas sp. Leaf324 TaxID=1736336 RepID=UPI0006FF70F1|nr:MFS transporter [Aureimonas sp. Leaf324]KQQ85665.1 MFS transporter [Aureimonas sp. Leaf324]